MALKIPFLKKKIEKRMMDTQSFFAMLANPEAIELNEFEAMSIPTFYAAVDMISNAIASLNVELYQEKAAGSIVRKSKDYRLQLLNKEPNDFINGFNFKKHFVKDYLLYGRAFAEVVNPTATKILEINPMRAEAMILRKFTINGYKVGPDTEYYLSVSDESAGNKMTETEVVFRPYQLMIALKDSHDGVYGYGILEHGHKILKQALAEIKVAHKFYKRGAMPLSVLTVADNLNEDEAAQLRASWQQIYGGSDNAAQTIILSDGMKFQNLTSQELTDTMDKKFAMDIMKLFNLPDGLLATADREKYHSLEQAQQNYLINCLQPIINSFEAALNKSMLLEREKRNGYFFRFDTSQLVRATIKDLADSIVATYQGGLYTLNEARAKFNLPDVPNGANFVLLPGQEQVQASGDKAPQEQPADGSEDSTFADNSFDNSNVKPEKGDGLIDPNGNSTL